MNPTEQAWDLHGSQARPVLLSKLSKVSMRPLASENAFKKRLTAYHRLTVNSNSRDIMGVTVERITPGDGQTFPKTGDTVYIHYVGTLTNGKKFDSSRDRGSPFKTLIGVGKVIKGWDEGTRNVNLLSHSLLTRDGGVPQLSVGEKAILTCSADYAYGSRGFPPVIPPDSVLQFEVELLKIEPASPA
ncbi:hypothetical protein CCMSSC00406_0000627 [Pleurotus cornucopiae]|uniref:Uncharacterized protein n=1 Tax=Pleurotus cornucopiae TaxID=5321 RepID=A0ACB7JAV2_PLECO|nr:hypothetical protein CCMSSC00406_0000627 [Pleurotus cornucopiae]